MEVAGRGWAQFAHAEVLDLHVMAVDVLAQGDQ